MIDVSIQYLFSCSEDGRKNVKLKAQENAALMYKEIKELERRIKVIETALSQECAKVEIIDWINAQRDKVEAELTRAKELVRVEMRRETAAA